MWEIIRKTIKNFTESFLLQGFFRDCTQNTLIFEHNKNYQINLNLT